MSPKIYFRCGFTLIEILIVILIIAIVSGIVAPVAYKGVEGFKRLIRRAETANRVRMEKFFEFISDSRCTEDNGSFVCGKIRYEIK